MDERDSSSLLFIWRRENLVEKITHSSHLTSDVKHHGKNDAETSRRSNRTVFRGNSGYLLYICSVYRRRIFASIFFSALDIWTISKLLVASLAFCLGSQRKNGHKYIIKLFNPLVHTVALQVILPLICIPIKQMSYGIDLLKIANVLLEETRQLFW